MKTGIHVEGGKATPLARAVVAALSKALELAIVTGREQSAVEIAKQMGDVSGVKNLVITNCVIGDSPR